MTPIAEPHRVTDPAPLATDETDDAQPATAPQPAARRLTAFEPTRVAYEWVGARPSSQATATRPLAGPTVAAPPTPGFAPLALLPRTGALQERRVLGELALAVHVPFGQKLGGLLNGYRIGTYPF